MMKRKLIYVISSMLLVGSLVGCGAKKETKVETVEPNEISKDISPAENSNETDKGNTETEQSDLSVDEMFSTTSADGGVCISGYNGTEENAIVVIPSEIDGEPVVELASTFASDNRVKEVVIPDTVKKLDSTFYLCTNLEKVTLGTGIDEVGENTFMGCPKLMRLEFADGLKKIDYMGITSCESLEYVSLPDGVEEIDDTNFGGCSDAMVISAPSGSATEEFAKTWEFNFEAK